MEKSLAELAIEIARNSEVPQITLQYVNLHLLPHDRVPLRLRDYPCGFLDVIVSLDR